MYFGPYPNAGELNKILHVIYKFFPLVRCSKRTFKTISRPCNYYHIHQCLAPCHLNVDNPEYIESVHRVIALLRGKTKDIIEKIKIDMKQASMELNFEKAAKLRDSIIALQSISEQQSVDLDIIFDVDFCIFLATKEYFVFYVSYVRGGAFVGADSYVDVVPECLTTTEEILTSILLQFYDKHESPEHIFCITNLLNESMQKNIKTFIIEKSKHNVNFYTEQKNLFKNLKIKKENQKKIGLLIDLFLNNAKSKLEEKIKISSSAAEKLVEVQNLLSLPRLPQWIECYDISTFQGAATVGSRVVFKNGLPFKSMYRKYIIKEHIGKMDDFASLKEVLRRRFKDRHIEDIDLLMVDGGTPQVREAAYLFKSLGLENIFFVGIAKQRTLRDFKESFVQTTKERLVIPARDQNHELLPEAPPQTIELEPHSKAFQLLVSVRNEAHRFAITFHRKRLTF